MKSFQAYTLPIAAQQSVKNKHPNPFLTLKQAAKWTSAWFKVTALHDDAVSSCVELLIGFCLRAFSLSQVSGSTWTQLSMSVQPEKNELAQAARAISKSFYTDTQQGTLFPRKFPLTEHFQFSYKYSAVP